MKNTFIFGIYACDSIIDLKTRKSIYTLQVTFVADLGIMNVAFSIFCRLKYRKT